MKFRNPFFVENLMQDQPYCSLLLLAPYCDGACPGCQNVVLKESDVVDMPLQDLVRAYRNNPFVDGITVAGLEICLSGDDFVRDLLEFVREAQVPRVTIYSRFQPQSPRLAEILERLAAIPTLEELYCKSGAYRQDGQVRKVELQSTLRPQTHWSISLASANQDFLVIKGREWVRVAA